MADNEELPWRHCQPRIQNIIIAAHSAWGGGGGGCLGCRVFKKIYTLLCVQCIAELLLVLSGGAPFVCSGAVETRLHVMMTFVPVCVWCYSRAWQLRWPTFPLPLSLLHVTERRGVFRKWNLQIRAGWHVVQCWGKLGPGFNPPLLATLTWSS